MAQQRRRLYCTCNVLLWVRKPLLWARKFVFSCLHYCCILPLHCCVSGCPWTRQFHNLICSLAESHTNKRFSAVRMQNKISESIESQLCWSCSHLQGIQMHKNEQRLNIKIANGVTVAYRNASANRLWRHTGNTNKCMLNAIMTSGRYKKYFKKSSRPFCTFYSKLHLRRTRMDHANLFGLSEVQLKWSLQNMPGILNCL